MQKPEFRVRPVIRHVVTRYTPAEPKLGEAQDANGRSSLETLGEFDSEDYAQIVREALAEGAADREYIMVSHAPGSAEAKVQYAYSEADVSHFLASSVLGEHGWQVFSRTRTPQPY